MATTNGLRGHLGFSHTAYDVLRVGVWALVIFGVLLIMPLT
jgi:hypothetical protein